jgi:hypothetical protein
VSAGAAEAVTEGIEGIFVSAADKIFELSISGYHNPGQNGTVAYIYNIATYTLNPFETTTYDNVKAFSGAVFMKGYKLVLLIAFIMLMMTHYRADIAMKINAVTGINIAQKTNMLAKKAFDGIVIAAFMYVFIFFILWFNDILTKAVMLNMLDSIAPVPNNFILYFMMAVAYGFMMFFFGFRMLIIGLFFGFAFLIGLGLLIEPVRHTAETICAYFVQIVFFQFIIVAYFSLSILIIKSLDTMGSNESFMYFIMICGGVYLGIKMMFGTGVIRWAGRTAARVV